MRRLITLSAALVTLAVFTAGAQAQSKDRYCLIQAHNGAKNCGFVTLKQCQQSKGAPSDTCERNTGTTGQARRK